MKKLVKFSIGLLSIMPFLTFAQQVDNYWGTLAGSLKSLSDQIVVFLIAILVIAFPIGIILGIVFAVRASGQQDKIKKTKSIWISVLCSAGPIVGIAVVVSLWGLLAVLSSVFSN